MRNIRELVTVVILIALLAVLVLWYVGKNHSPRGHSYRQACADSLAIIGKACIAYQEPNGGYFPAFMQGVVEGAANPNTPKSGQGADYAFQPMPSLAVLYPGYIDNVNVFRCPSGIDKPAIALRYYNGARHTCFGYQIDPLEKGPNGPPGATGPTAGPTTTGYNWTDPAWYTGAEVSTQNKCSYFYDELTGPRMMKPDQAIACDADGQTWLIDEAGRHPPYPADWKRLPKMANHWGSNGQNVLYYDGHVKWLQTVYAGHDPADNIFCPQAGWDADSDAYLWDGVNARPAQTAP